MIIKYLANRAQGERLYHPSTGKKITKLIKINKVNKDNPSLNHALITHSDL